ncbi:uncharacterized protein YALI1_D32181g [Yarrowia lipolytica]|uniref:Uncharacterized protein n=1 Tax=Yarrowia lipolytica TaxID=4952 RepID=A0A1D8NG11_YARLL|nr:hypothetical protein YALI1_D32181g [Yarrowia lipolytica]
MVCSGLSETVINHSVNVWELTRSLHAPDSQISMGGYSQHVIRTFLSFHSILPVGIYRISHLSLRSRCDRRLDKLVCSECLVDHCTKRHTGPQREPFRLLHTRCTQDRLILFSSLPCQDGLSTYFLGRAARANLVEMLLPWQL